MGQWHKLCGLYLNESKDGTKKFMTGYLGMMKICIFKNEKKESGSKDHDYNLMICDRPAKKKDGNSTGGNEYSQGTPPPSDEDFGI